VRPLQRMPILVHGCQHNATVVLELGSGPFQRVAVLVVNTHKEDKLIDRKGVCSGNLFAFK